MSAEVQRAEQETQEKTPAQICRVRMFVDERGRQVMELTPVDAPGPVRYRVAFQATETFSDGLSLTCNRTVDLPASTPAEAFAAFDAAAEGFAASADVEMEAKHTRDALSGRLPSGLPQGVMRLPPLSRPRH